MRIAEIAQPLPLQKTFDYEIPENLRSSAVPGVRVRAPFGGVRRLVGTLISVREGQPDRPLKPIEAVLDQEPLLTQDQLELAAWMAKRYCASLGECCRILLPSFVNAKQSKRMTIVNPIVKAAAAPWAGSATSPAAQPAQFKLTDGQSNAVEALQAQLRANRFFPALLFGVPASGKTEVYLRLIREAIKDGGQALYLLPEISLTQPFFDELSKRAGFSVALWHSQLGVSQRRSVWLGLRRGDIQVVVGARSACLLPFKRLRIAIVDEEQDESYKQDTQPPLYHARDVVLERAKRSGAVAVFGSATPSIEAVHQIQSGGWKLLEMPDRISAHARPVVEIIDKPMVSGGCLSPELLERMKDRLGRREQIILLVNRRGFSNFIICRKCRWIARCASCSLAYIHHQKVEREEVTSQFELRCHHCGRRAQVPEKCASCQKPGLSFAGVGTQKVVSELKYALPGARVLRMDRDTVSKEKSQDEAKIYDLFKSKAADILVGTKLVAKGFHFPDVTLVGIVDADTMLHMPDFRSAERTAQVLIQAAGRAGRADKPGEVLLQTSYPEHYALQAVARGDYLHFARQELQFRKDLFYPPAAPLLRLIFSGIKEESVASAAEEAAQQLRFMLGAGCEVLGPSPAVYHRLRGRFRYHLLVKIKDQSLDLLARLPEVSVLPGVKMQVHVDPYDMF